MTTADETWKPIPGFPGYEVSDHGQVRSYRTRYGRTEWYISDTPQRILRSCNTSGYRFVYIANDNGDFTSIRVHSLVLLAFVGPCPKGMEVCHNDGDKANNDLSNLRYDTHSANLQDALKSGTATTVLNEDLVVAIRHLHSKGVSYQKIATRLGISEGAAWAAGTGRTWKHVDTPCSKAVRKKLSDSDILTILERVQHEKQCDLAAEYSVSTALISLIVNGKYRVPANGTN